ncbi:MULTISPECIES: toprim domain-containing protein, partial [unclassified Breznakia]|uniref:toprim domain-containing protein n=1 Tax=unclassified Breznakia TaxID=2623764 RepID=UPI00247415A4
CECNQLERSDPNTPSESHGMAFWALPRGSLLELEKNLEIIRKIRKELNIVDVAHRLLKEPKQIKPKKVKWNITYQSFYTENDTDPSLKISEKYQVFHCYSTSHHGDVFSLVKDYFKYKEGKEMSIEDVIDYILKEFSSEINLDDMNVTKKKVTSTVYSDSEREYIAVINEIVKYSSYILDYDVDGKSGQDFLNNRKISKETSMTFSLGFVSNSSKLLTYLKSKKLKNLDYVLEKHHIFFNDEFVLKNRLLIPIKDKYGENISLIGRKIDDIGEDVKYKFLMSSDSEGSLRPNDFLFNFDGAINDIKALDNVYIVEGSFDVFRLREIGVRNVVALLTNNITDKQIKALKELSVSNITFFLDGDEGGRNGYKNIFEKIAKMKDNNQYQKSFEYSFRRIYFFDDDDYYLKKKDPDSLFIDKDISSFEKYKEKFKDYRTDLIRQNLEEYEKNQISISNLFDSVGEFILYYSPNYIKEIEVLINNDAEQKSDDMRIFKAMFVEDEDVDSLYLMDKFSLEQFYAKEVIHELKGFRSNYLEYSVLMGEVYSIFNRNLSQEYDINNYQQLNGRRIYSKNILTVEAYEKETHNKMYSVELDYINGSMGVYQRMCSEKKGKALRDDNNFLEIKYFKDISKSNKKDEAISYIKEIVGEE